MKTSQNLIIHRQLFEKNYKLSNFQKNGLLKNYITKIRIKGLGIITLTIKKSNKEMQSANLYNKLDKLNSVGQFLERLKLLIQNLEERNLALSIIDKKRLIWEYF